MKDKREIILKFLYDNKYNNVTAYGDIKPLMKGWSKNEIVGTLDWLMHPIAYIAFSSSRSPFMIDALQAGVPVATMENYQALACIKPEGEQYYKDNYRHATWKKFQLIFDVVSKPSAILLTIGSLALSILSWRTNVRLREEVRHTTDSIRYESKMQFEHLNTGYKQLSDSLALLRKTKIQTENSGKLP